MSYLHRNHSMLPLKSSVQRRVVAARSVMDLRSVGSSWAFTYSTRRTERERSWRLHQFKHVVTPLGMPYMNSSWFAAVLTVALSLHTETEWPHDTRAISERAWRYKQMWCDYASFCAHRYYCFNGTCFSSTWLWVAVEKTQTQCGRHLSREDILDLFIRGAKMDTIDTGNLHCYNPEKQSSSLKTREEWVRDGDCQLTEDKHPVISRPKSLLLRQRFAMFTACRQNGKNEYSPS